MEYSLADIAAACHGNGSKDGYAEWMNNPFIYLLFFAWMQGGLGGNNLATNNAFTRAEMYEGFNFNQLQNDTRDIERAISAGNTVNAQGQAELMAAINQNAFTSQKCCCETNRNIDALRYETQKQTCDITTAIHAEAENTRALFTQNLIQGLRDKLADRDRDLMTANFQLSQQAQNANLIQTLRPFPLPAYITSSPYQSVNNGYGCGYACSC